MRKSEWTCIFKALARAFGTESDASDTAAVHVEFGIGFAAGLYFSGSGGVGFDVPELKTAKITSTTCWGVKFDVSFGGGISVSFLPKMSDLLGTAVTIELGMDVPGTEIGFDFLIHYSPADRKFVGFGLAFGMGIGLSPVDFASSRCSTNLIAEYQDSVKIAMGYAGPSWTCHLNLLVLLVKTNLYAVRQEMQQKAVMSIDAGLMERHVLSLQQKNITKELRRAGQRQ